MRGCKYLLTGLLCAGLTGGVGCRHCSKRSARGTDRVPPPPGATFLETPVPASGSVPPPPSGSRIPPPDLPTTPAPNFDGPSGPGPVPTTPPPSIPDSAPAPRGTLRIDPAYPPPTSENAPRGVPAPKPRQPEILYPDSLGTPEAVAATPPPNSAASPAAPRVESRGYLGEPIAPQQMQKPNAESPTIPPAKVPLPSEPTEPRTESPPPPPSRSTAVPFDPGLLSRKAGLSGLSPVADLPNVFAGRRLTLEGFDTLQAAGVRTALYLHAPGTDIAPARELTERRGLRFVSIAVTPQTLEAALQEFTAAVTTAENRPLYVYDDTGSRSGILWYLFFRTVDRLGDDVARLRAGPLGLREAAPDELQAYWLATQAILEKR